MKIPKKMNICGQVYNIKMKEPEAGDWMGLTIIGRNTIYIDPTLSKQCIESTLIHEIIEVINFQLELKLPHNYIMSLETALYQVFKDNGMLK